MSCKSITEARGVTPGASGAEVLPYNLHRKALFLACVGSAVKVAFGETPAAVDYFDMGPGSTLVLDSLVPISKVWASGTGGKLVIGESA